MPRQTQTLRNLGIIAHIDAGKTTVTERMLYLSGAKHRVGRVDSGTAETDSDPEEQQRGITIYSACVTFPWKKWHINLLDTPGHVDFTAEVERCLRVLDGAVVVFSAREGVEAQSETVWRQANRYGVPRLAFINKLDREGADFERVFQQIQQRLNGKPVALQIPVGQGPGHTADPFRGVIDLLEMRMLTFSEGDDGKQVTAQPIPDELADTAAVWRETLLETLYDFSNEMMELALQEQEVPLDLLRKVIREATLHEQIQPVFCGSALHGIGVQPLLDGVGFYLPSPIDRPPVEGTLPDDLEKKIQRAPRDNDPFCGLIFKVLPARTGDLYWIRVYSGTLKANSRHLNPNREKKENVAQLWQIHVTRKERDGQVPEVICGDIVGMIGPRDSLTGDTLCDARQPILLPSIRFAETVISMAIEPETAAERKKLGEALDMLRRQDPTFSVRENEDTGQTLIGGMGELHLEIIEHRLLREFNLNVKVHAPRVSYRETIDGPAEVEGQCNRQLAGVVHYGRIRLKLEPLEQADAGVEVISRVPLEAEIPPDLIEAAVEELRTCGQGGGPIGSFPLTRLRLTVLNAEIRDENSDEVAFRIAAADAFEKGLRKAGPVLLEPIMRLEINTPEEYLGDIVGDLQQRRAIVVGTENLGTDTVIEAHAPLKELFGYSKSMRSRSQGRATCSMEPLRYAPAPPEVVREYELA